MAGAISDGGGSSAGPIMLADGRKAVTALPHWFDHDVRPLGRRSALWSRSTPQHPLRLLTLAGEFCA
jgi:hypothetical protein